MAAVSLILGFTAAALTILVLGLHIVLKLLTLVLWMLTTKAGLIFTTISTLAVVIVRWW